MSYKVVHKHHDRVSGDGQVERFNVNDEIDPTDDELKAFPDRFVEMDQPTARRRRSVEASDKPGDSGSSALFSGAEKDANKE